MFQVNDTILYGTDGVCTISEITHMTIKGKTLEYYVLKPAQGSQSTIYVPTQNEKLLGKMRKVLSAEEIHEMIQSMPDEETVWIEDEAERKQTCARILQSGDRRALIRMIKALYLHQQDLKRAGRKFHVSDERFLKEAERILYNEFAHVLHLEQSEVLPFIREQIGLLDDCPQTDGVPV